MTHQHRLHGVPAPNRTLVQSSVLNLVLSMMVFMLFSIFPLPAIKDPVYASCNVACSYIANRIPAVHCVKALTLLKWNKYRFLPAVEMLRTLFSGSASAECVGNVSIWEM